MLLSLIMAFRASEFAETGETKLHSHGRKEVEIRRRINGDKCSGDFNWLLKDGQRRLTHN